MPWFERDGLRFHYLDDGQAGSIPFVFQHGLGATAHQPEELYTPLPGLRFLALDCRGHGETQPLGDPNGLSFNTFADDVLALLTELGEQRAVVGGISMGAGVALNFALRYPESTLGLVLSRPAWLDEPLPLNLRHYPVMAKLIREHGAAGALERFRQSGALEAVRRESPDAASSLEGQFGEARAEAAVARLEQIPADAPNRHRAQWGIIRVPTLVMANMQDPVHPFEYGEALARAIPGAVLRELTPKSVSREQHQQDTRRHLAEFLSTHFAE
jgi:pimeloyl-ACP methyl ester carboxylesterase